MYTLLLFFYTTLGYENVSGYGEIAKPEVQHFICVDGSRISLSDVCNGKPECPDSSDELRKLCQHVVCPTSMYRCAYGACISRESRCDGLQDCTDGSDELHCQVTEICSDREFQCVNSTECISLSKICNGYPDCLDSSDESSILCNEYPCPMHTYHCLYGGCVHQEVICDGIKDCIDGSDENDAVCAAINCVGDECQNYKCRDGEFSCDSQGQCLPDSRVCDGVHQCRDGSDENSKMCKSRDCPQDWFRCTYGGCISKNLTCNLQPNCHDWSDEEETICGVSLPEGTCRLPPAQPGTHYTVVNCPECRPGDVVAELTRLDYTCDVEGSLEGSSSIYCQDNTWLPSVPTCPTGTDTITCSPVESGGVIKRCEAKWGPHQGWISCESPVPVGTQVTLECPAYYERVNGVTSVTCLHDGTWSQLPLSCNPICGRRESSVAALIVKGWEVLPDESLPWHATLFSHDDGKWDFFCGGTLIAERVVLTAGHCVWKTSVDTVKVALAAYSSNFSNLGGDAQILNVERIEVQDSYQDHEGNYGSDLALLILNKPPAINSVIRPACIDWINTQDVSQRIGDIGLVTGMGVTENDTYSSILRVTTVQLVSDDMCREKQKRDFRKYLTYTSFCAGWGNGTSVCNGDSGGGLVLQKPNSTFWEVHGVVSISPRRPGTSFCDPMFYTVFTKVSVYRTWIKQILNTIAIVGPPDMRLKPNTDIVNMDSGISRDNEGVRSSVIIVQEGTDVQNVPESIEILEFTGHDNISITPSYMEFKDASEGTTYRQLMIIQNTGNKPALIRICAPNSIAFKIRTLESGVLLSPGLTISRQVEYSYKRPSLLHAMIPIQINGTFVDYHVVCSLATECISMQPSCIDFGIVDIGCSSGVKILTITNNGGKSTRFSVDLGKNDLEINVKPTRGVVRLYSHIELRVELIGTKEGTFYSEFWIKSTPNVRIPIRVNIIIPRLVVYHLNTTGDFTLIDFSPTFINTENYNTLVLRNLSSQITSFVVLGEVDNELFSIKNISAKTQPAYRAFKIYPTEGRMQPFEGIVFRIVFSPTPKLMHQTRHLKTTECQDFMVFIRILRVHCTEVEDVIKADAEKDSNVDESFQNIYMPQPSASVRSTISLKKTPSQSSFQETVRLCLYGEVEKPRLTFTPDELHLEALTIGEIADRVICIRNSSIHLPILYRFVNQHSVHCTPKSSSIRPTKSIEVLIRIQGKFNTMSPLTLSFELMGETKNGSGGKVKKYVTIDTSTVPCFVDHINIPKMKSKTKYTMGLLSLKTNKAVSSVEANSTKLLDGKSANQVSGGKSARLNDTQKSLKPYKKSSTVSSEELKYLPGENLAETYSPEEMARKIKERDYWAKYLRTVQTQKNSILRKNMLEMYTYDDLICGIVGIPRYRIESVAQRISKAENEKLVAKAKNEILVPLSPIQIYNVKVSPTIFSYGQVAPKSMNYRELTIENRNQFPIMVRLACVNKCIRFPNGSRMILRPGSLEKNLIEYRTQEIGKFNTYIGYAINDNHFYQLAITADVVYKYLTLGTREIVFGLGYLPEETYQPTVSFVQIRNKLDARTTFRWQVPAAASFSVEPSFGTVRGNRSLLVGVNYEPNAAKSHQAEVTMSSEGGNYLSLKLDTILSSPDVAFINDTLNFGKIPLNITTTGIGVLHNAEFTEVMYEVNVLSLIYGCEVYPDHGTIPPRGIATLEIRLKLDACLQFSVKVHVMVQKCLKLQLKLNGEVNFPMLKFSPEVIEMGRVSADAFQIHLITVTNVGTATAKIQFLVTEYPEFCVALSPTVNDPGIGSKSITIAPSDTVEFYLRFVPIDLASYAFYLPILINELLGPILMENQRMYTPYDFLKPREEHYSNISGIDLINFPQTLPTIYIDCTVAGHVISFSKLVFHFNVTTNQDELCVFNNTDRETSFIIRIDDFHTENCPFTIKWINGVESTMTDLCILCKLQPAEKTIFKIEFVPSQRGRFSLEAPIFVRGELEGNMFNCLQLYGDNPISSIDSDTCEIYFFPIPLKNEAEEKITLTFSHYKSTTNVVASILAPIKCSGIMKENTLKILFPNGNTISGTRRSENIETIITFKSEEPVSLCTRIEFHDDKNLSYYSIMIFATADNNLLTTHASFRSSIESIKIGPQPEISYISIQSDDEESIHMIQQPGTVRKYTNESLPRHSAHSNISQYSKTTFKVTSSSTKLKATPVDEAEDEDSKQEEGDNIYIDAKDSDNLQNNTRMRDQSKLSYPFFPNADRSSLVRLASTERLTNILKYLQKVQLRCSDYAQHMQAAMKTAEEWLYSCPLRFNFYPNVVDGITAVLSGLCLIRTPTKDKRKSHAVNQSFIDVLESLIGNNIFKYIQEPVTLPENDEERINHVLSLYNNILHFLMAQGACLAHVYPEFLLSYTDYIKASQMRNSSSKKDRLINIQLDRELFDSRSKQCWLDVILQTYKTLVLSRVDIESLENNIYSRMSMRISDITGGSSLSLANLPQKSNFTSIINIAAKNIVHCKQEALLLAWLDYHFEIQRKQDWMIDDRVILNPNETKDVLQQRAILDFDDVLCDGLVFIAVTAAYCPFLIDEYFRNIYISPRNVEERFHNAICIVAAWRKIRLGFMIGPSQITKPNCVQMLMLVVHLFQILPTYTTRTKIKFSCPLTETITRRINFSNVWDNGVNYIVQFINNESAFFSAVQPHSIFHINPRDSNVLMLKFYARKMQKTKAYLLLCGSAIASHFAINQLFVLEGSANHLGIVDTYNITNRLYRVVDKDLKIRVPYKYTAEYDIWLTEDPPTNPAELRMARWADLRLRKVPRRLFVNQNTLSIAENEEIANLSVTIACIEPSPRKFWLIFQSRMGDFIIQINSCSTPTISEKIIIQWDKEKCVCIDPPSNVTETCPLNITIKIPSRNGHLWNCISQMFQKTLNPKERDFWARHLDTNIGLRLIHWLMGDHTDSAAMEFIHIFKTCVTYNVTTTSKPNLLTVPATFTIPDVRPLQEECEMTIHILATTPKLYETKLILTSLDKKELRYLEINLICRQQTEPSITENKDEKRKSFNAKK